MRMQTSAVHGAKAKTRLGRFLKRDHERGDTGTFEAGGNNARDLLEWPPGRERLLSSWIAARFSLILCSRPFVPITCRLHADPRYGQSSIAGRNHDFPRGSSPTRIPLLTGESHAGHAFAALRPDLLSRRFARRHARRPCPLEVVATEPASDIDRLADEI
jgi:hypothetical protein